MSSFKCEHCGTDILDSVTGYTTGCEHYPIERFPNVRVVKEKGHTKSFVFNNLKGRIDLQ